LERGIAWWAICVALSLLGICPISISGRLPLLRAVVGFTLGLAIFRFAGYLDRLSAVAQDVLVVVVLVGIVAAAAFNPYD
jgi:hypothetical protein